VIIPVGPSVAQYFEAPSELKSVILPAEVSTIRASIMICAIGWSRACIVSSMRPMIASGAVIVTWFPSLSNVQYFENSGGTRLSSSSQVRYSSSRTLTSATCRKPREEGSTEPTR